MRARQLLCEVKRNAICYRPVEALQYVEEFLPMLELINPSLICIANMHYVAFQIVIEITYVYSIFN